MLSASSNLESAVLACPGIGLMVDGSGVFVSSTAVNALGEIFVTDIHWEAINSNGKFLRALAMPI